MSATLDINSVANSWKRQPWGLWSRQVAAILRLEVRRNFLGARSILIYLFAFAPVLIMAAVAVGARISPKMQSDPGFVNIVFANVYEAMILRTVVFFGCAWLFMNLFRGEVVDKSLHYYFLCPVRREVLLVGKYLSGAATSGILFTATTAMCLFFLYMTIGFGYLGTGSGIREAFSYLSITLLGCVGYGAFFLVVGLLFRNPIIPALLGYGWEWLNFLLPPVLKKISVIHYLHSLMPVPVPEGPFAVLAEPTPAWIAIPGFAVVIVLALVFASFRIRRMQISYSGD